MARRVLFACDGYGWADSVRLRKREDLAPCGVRAEVLFDSDGGVTLPLGWVRATFAKPGDCMIVNHRDLCPWHARLLFGAKEA